MIKGELVFRFEINRSIEGDYFVLCYWFIFVDYMIEM